MNTKITEIIPKNMPDWAIDAMEDGQLFNITFNRIKQLEEALNMISGASRPGSLSGAMVIAIPVDVWDRAISLLPDEEITEHG